MENHYEKCIARGKFIVIHVFAGLVMALAFGLIFGYFVMLLWNNLVPSIFGLKEITTWQGTGLVILSRLLIGTRGYGHSEKRFKRYRAAKVNDQSQIWWETEGQQALEKYLTKQTSDQNKR